MPSMEVVSVLKGLKYFEKLSLIISDLNITAFCAA